MKFLKNSFSGFLIFLSVTLIQGCSSLLYYPTRHQHYDPKKADLVWDDVQFNSLDGTKLKGWYFYHSDKKLKKPKAILVFFHGNGENRSTHFATLTWVLEQGYDFFIFDYRGYAESEGSPDPRGTVLDGMAALRWAKQKNVDDVPLVVFAQSLGGAVAARSLIELKGEVPIRLLFLDSSFASYQWAGMSVLSQSWLGTILQPFAYLFLSDEWAPGDQIAKIWPTPIIVMHGDRDQIIDFKLGQKLFELAKEPKEFIRVEGGQHIDAFWRHDGKYKKIFLEKLENLIR